jgi:hypothetical protein
LIAWVEAQRTPTGHLNKGAPIMTTQPENKDKAKDELSDQAVEKVTGGRPSSAPSVKEITVTKPTDVASP